ncbi:MAG TPA: peptidoglycan recognition family protein [Chloroflexota bacterium]
MRLSRRALLAGLTVALVGGPAAVGGAEPAPTRGWRWRGSARSAASAEPIRAPYPINAVGASLPGPIAGLRLRVSADGASWGDWLPLTADEAHGRAAPDGRRYADLVTVPPGSRYVQVEAERPLDDLRLDLIDSTPGPATPAGRLAQGVSVPIIPRGEWGCDERLRFDAQGREIWPPERQPPEKVVVHHTATANREADTAASVRAVYYYHAVTQGWGDIGYNYLVDWKGNAFEGRYGGRGVEGGHAYGHNPGSIGIACLGTFTTEAATIEMRQSLARLIAQVGSYIDPHDSSWFVDGEMPNLMGHRDAMQYRPADATECPGDALYGLLPGLRGDVLYNLGAPPTASAALLEVRYEPDSRQPGATLKVTATLKNTGSATLTTQDPSPGLLYLESDSFASRGLPERVGAWRLGLTTGQGDYPFRWGLPAALEPGQTATVTGQVRLGGAGPRALSVGLVRESRYWYARDLWPSALVLGQPPALTRRTILPLSARNGRP